MAVGDTDVSICNKALLLLGSGCNHFISDGTPAAQACSTIYNEVKLTTFGMYPGALQLQKQNW